MHEKKGNVSKIKYQIICNFISHLFSGAKFDVNTKTQIHESMH